MCEDYGDFQLERDNYISTIRDELEHLSDEILTTSELEDREINNT